MRGERKRKPEEAGRTVRVGIKFELCERGREVKQVGYAQF